MKKGLLLSLIMLAGIAGWTQAPPQLMNYQAIVRDASGVPVVSGTPVKLRFTIHDGSVAGSSVYQEIDNDTTNAFGLVNAQIGSNGNLSIVSWGSGPKFLQVEAQVGTATAFTDMGTSQLLSVPYALFAGNGGGGGGTTGPQGPTGATGAT